MKHTAYIIIIAILFILCGVLIFDLVSEHKRSVFLSGNASYWKAKYDSVVNRNGSEIHNWTTDSATFLMLDTSNIKMIIDHPRKAGIIHTRHPVRHARHRGEKQKIDILPYEEAIYMDTIDDMKGADGPYSRSYNPYAGYHMPLTDEQINSLIISNTEKDTALKNWYKKNYKILLGLMDTTIHHKN